MSLATMARTESRSRTSLARRAPTRLILVISGRAYRLAPYVTDRSLQSEFRHELRGPDGRWFSVYEADWDMEELRKYCLHETPLESRHHCEACGRGDCAHVEALVELGLF